MKPPRRAHGILAHYFRGPDDPVTDDALTAEQWSDGLDAYGTRLIGAQEWLEAFRKKKLGDAVCVTMDDGLVCQRIGLEVLEARKLTAFLFIITGTLLGVRNMVADARWIRMQYETPQAFDAAWRPYARAMLKARPMPRAFLENRPYLTVPEREFRWWRNALVTPEQYERVMWALAPKKTPPWHWFGAPDLRDYHGRLHRVGFHSHSHPMTLATLSVEQQALEYATSAYLIGTVGTSAYMSHPCGSYTPEGLRRLRAEGVLLGFAATMMRPHPLAMPSLRLKRRQKRSLRSPAVRG